MTATSIPTLTRHPSRPARPSDGAPAVTVLRQGEGRRVEAGLMPITVLLSPDDCKGRLLANLQDVPPLALVRAHIHERATQFTMVLEGVLDVLVGERTYRLGPGSSIARPPGLVHAVWNPDPLYPARQLEITTPGQDQLDFFAAMEELYLSDSLTTDALARAAAPYGTFYNDELTQWIEDEYQVSASGDWR